MAQPPPQYVSRAPAFTGVNFALTVAAALNAIVDCLPDPSLRERVGGDKYSAAECRLRLELAARVLQSVFIEPRDDSVAAALLRFDVPLDAVTESLINFDVSTYKCDESTSEDIDRQMRFLLHLYTVMEPFTVEALDWKREMNTVSQTPSERAAALVFVLFSQLTFTPDMEPDLLAIKQFYAHNNGQSKAMCVFFSKLSRQQAVADRLARPFIEARTRALRM
jgi:hypothetical protein